MKKKGQVWIETVIYTLIGLTVIGILLGFGKPKIDAMKDKVLIEQTIESLNQINDKIYDVQIPGNKRFLGLKIAKGTFTINASNDEIIWTILSSYKYSELGEVVNSSNMQFLTTQGNPYKVDISMNYNLNLTYDSQDISRSFEASPSQYTLVIENKPSSNGINIDLLVK
jgi:hypothetical protein